MKDDLLEEGESLFLFKDGLSVEPEFSKKRSVLRYFIAFSVCISKERFVSLLMHV